MRFVGFLDVFFCFLGFSKCIFSDLGFVQKHGMVFFGVNMRVFGVFGVFVSFLVNSLCHQVFFFFFPSPKDRR